MIVYEEKGVCVYLEELEAVAIYVEGKHCITMTLDEWRAINDTLQPVNE